MYINERISFMTICSWFHLARLSITLCIHTSEYKTLCNDRFCCPIAMCFSVSETDVSADHVHLIASAVIIFTYSSTRYNHFWLLSGRASFSREFLFLPVANECVYTYIICWLLYLSIMHFCIYTFALLFLKLH